MAPKVRVSDLRKRYGPLEAVAGVSFDINDGEIFGLLGPNGAGKTTTIECVLGLNTPDSGDIEICGIDARRHPRAVREKVGAALQTTALPDRITAREALEVFGAFYQNRQPTEALLQRFSLTSKADVAVDTLSGGQKQRLALALAFVNSPELVFLDEPTAGLDAHSRRELHGEIQKMRADGHTVLLTTHLLDEADLLCDRIAIISKGRIVAVGSPRELVARSARLQQISFETDRPFAATLIAGLPGVQRERHDHAAGEDISGGVLHTTTPGATVIALVSALESQGIGLEQLHVQKATLEDVFVELTDVPVEAAR
jgi:ABC-2 type transport system ATP-binding protein